jgi:hypothetical protein
LRPAGIPGKKERNHKTRRRQGKGVSGSVSCPAALERET